MAVSYTKIVRILTAQ